MPSPYFQGNPDYIKAHTEVLSTLSEMWSNYSDKRKIYADALLNFNWKNKGMNNVEQNMIDGTPAISAARTEFLDAQVSLKAAHREYKASMSDLIQSKRF